VPTLEKIYLYLIEIATTEEAVRGLTVDETNQVELYIRQFIELRDRVLKFNPGKGDNLDSYQRLINEISSVAPNIEQALRTIFNFLKVKGQDFSAEVKKLEEVLGKATAATQNIENLKNQFAELPQQTEANFNKVAGELRDRLTQFENDQRNILENVRSTQISKIEKAVQETEGSLRRIQQRSTELTEEVDQKIDSVLQQTKNFSAKGALTTYSEIFNDEAQNVNKPAIEKWTWVLIILFGLEIGVALLLFYVFLPSAIDISKDFKSETVGITFLIGVLLTKAFILSVIAVAINHALKNLNAQRHLYTTNKFKANSLASFKAFIDATDSKEVVDKIIEKVAIAVYTQGVSGYLSKDDKQVSVLDERQVGFFSKLFAP